ncbi:winged helix-turn-helix domain-containing protein [Microbacterium sp. LMI12-1-1.1]|uniref:nSTAND1 domain-containing NTPase n=1 Tax=Microbacterium sp. LMI12-1-1.1 TaxID=3135225 RepID=UPI00342814BF
MRIRVLGPLELGDGTLGPRERALLTALIVRRGEALRPAELAEAWWGDDLPATWPQQIRNSIARIRSRLGADAIATLASSYRLDVDSDSIDAVRFETLVTAARAHAYQGDDKRAIDAYRRALGLWRGTPLQDAAGWHPGDAESRRLLEIRATAEEELLDARLRIGEHRAVLADAERLVRAEPLREDRWAILALADYRCGRQSDALAAIRAARMQLSEELGIEPGTRLSVLETAILRQDAWLDVPDAPVEQSTQCPYPGLRAFGPEEADLYFGREHDIDAAVERTRAGGMVIVAGPSGIGKSSLVLAGVVPRLRESGRTVEMVAPGPDAGLRLEGAAARADVLVVDQAEEILALPPADRDAFGTAAVSAMSQGRTLVMTARSDALDPLRALPGSGDALASGILLLGPISVTGCREAIEEPARRSGLRLEPGLVELALRDLGDRSGTLPLLSYALRETWIRGEGGTLTVAGYEDSGGIAGAVAQSAESVYQRLSPHEQDVCRSLLLRLLEREEDGTATRRRVPLAPILEDPGRRRVVEALAGARLLTLDDTSVVVTHEAVAGAWPRLADWLDEDADRARVVRLVEAAAAAWGADGRNDEDLLRGARLHTVLADREHLEGDLTEAERSFVAESEEREQSAVRQLEMQAARDRAHNRTLRAALGAAAGLLAAAVVAGGIAVVRGQEAAAASESARIEALVASALVQRNSDRDLAALLAAEAYRRWPDDDRTRSALLGLVMGADGLVRRVDYGGARVALAPIPRSEEAVLVRDDEDGSTVGIVDMDTGEVTRELDVPLVPAETPWDRAVAVSDGGQILAIQTPMWAAEAEEECCRNHFLFVDLGTGEALPSSQVLNARTTFQIALPEDGSVAYVGNPVTHDLQAIDVATGEVTVSSPEALADHTGVDGDSDSVAIIGPGAVAVGSPEALLVYDDASAALTRRIPTEGDLTSAGLIGDRAGGVIGAGPDGVARFDVTRGEMTWRAVVPPGRPCQYLALVESSGVIYCSRLGTVAALDLATGTWTGEEFATLMDEYVLPLPRVGGEEMLLHAPIASTTLYRRLDGTGPAAALVARGRLLAGGLDATGDVAITTSADGTGFQRWDIEADVPRGGAEEWLSWIGPDELERFSIESGLEIVADHDLDAGKNTVAHLDPVIVDALGDEIVLVPGRPGPHAFAFAPGVNTFFAVDPATGEAAGDALEVPGIEGRMFLNRVSESADGSRIALTYYDTGPQQTYTAVLDPRTGELLAHGAPATEGNAITGTGDLITVSDATLTRHDLDTLEPIVSFPKPFSSGNAIQVSDDGSTMLVVGWDNRAALYGLDGAVKLGDTIDAPSPELARGAQLSHDGRRLVTGTADGILVWDLDPALHARAACDIAGRELTAIEWATYFPGEDQRPTCTPD